MSFDIAHADSGSNLEFQPRGSMHTEGGKSASRSVGYVDIETPGRIIVEIEGGDGKERVMSFSRSRIMLFVRSIGISLLLIAVFGTGGIVLIIFGVAQRA